MDDPQNLGDLIPQPSGLELAPGVRCPADALRIQFSRSGGPGGQNVNKVNTKVEIWLDLARVVGLSEPALHRLRLAAGRRLTASGEIHLIGETARTQNDNRQEVMQRLREMILEARVEPRRRRKTRPTRASQKRRVDEKKHRGRTKSLRNRQDD